MTALVQSPETSPNDADWSAGWERWLRGHLAIELKSLHTALGAVLAEERQKFERKESALELKLAELSGAVDILRGAQPPPPAKFPSVKAWKEDTVHHEGDVVAFAGGTYQARCDTARAPGSRDWTCLATAGSGLAIRGTYSGTAEYRCLDVAMMNGSSFVALKDGPGLCPGEDWHLLASRGSRGSRGERGLTGLMGVRGERGAAAPTIQSWQIDRARYVVIPVMGDGSTGPPLELRGLFEQFFAEVAQ